MKTTINYIDELIEISRLLNKENDYLLVMKKILTAARNLCNADAGTFYLLSSDDKYLEFTAVQTESLELDLSKAEGTIPWPNLPLYKENGEQNDINISVHCALENKALNIRDIYNSTQFDFEGPKAFDSSTGYITKSMLVVPLISPLGKVIGVLQLINKIDLKSGEFIEFNALDEKLIFLMASLASVSVNKARLFKKLNENDKFSKKQIKEYYFDLFNKNIESFLSNSLDLEILQLVVQDSIDILDNYAVIEYDLTAELSVVNILSVGDDVLIEFAKAFIGVGVLDKFTDDEKKDIVNEVLNTVLGYVGAEGQDYFTHGQLKSPSTMDKDLLMNMFESVKVLSKIIKTQKGDINLSCIFRTHK